MNTEYIIFYLIPRASAAWSLAGPLHFLFHQLLFLLVAVSLCQGLGPPRRQSPGVGTLHSGGHLCHSRCGVSSRSQIPCLELYTGFGHSELSTKTLVGCVKKNEP